jgi:hypothetical protein
MSCMPRVAHLPPSLPPPPPLPHPLSPCRAAKGWFNSGYIFPEGFHARTLFRSSVALDSLCVHECYVIGKGGAYWPAPTFKVGGWVGPRAAGGGG